MVCSASFASHFVAKPEPTPKNPTNTGDGQDPQASLRMLYPRVILPVSVTPWTIMILVGVKFLTCPPKAEHIQISLSL